MRIALLFGALLLSGLLATAIVAGAVITQPATVTGDAFVKALMDADYATAFELCDPSLQNEFGSVQKLESWGKGAVGQPAKWAFTSRDVADDAAQLDGRLTMSDGRQQWIRLVLTKVDKLWKVAGFQVDDR